MAQMASGVRQGHDCPEAISRVSSRYNTVDQLTVLAYRPGLRRSQYHPTEQLRFLSIASGVLPPSNPYHRNPRQQKCYPPQNEYRLRTTIGGTIHMKPSIVSKSRAETWYIGRDQTVGHDDAMSAHHSWTCRYPTYSNHSLCGGYDAVWYLS